MSRVAPRSTLVTVWLGLMVLLAITAASAFIDLGAGNTVLNLAIAALKIALIAAYYMHLRHADHAVRLTAGSALFFLFILAFLAFGDFRTRSAQAAPWRSPYDESLSQRQ